MWFITFDSVVVVARFVHAPLRGASDYLVAYFSDSTQVGVPMSTSEPNLKAIALD